MIRNDPLDRRDDRAVSVAVTHVLAIGITTILIVSLLTAAGGLAEDEQDRSTREQLQMIGSSMANQVERADELGQRGADVTVRQDFEGTISGKSYSVTLETGNECDAATIDTNTCLVLDLSNSDVSATVGVSNRSAVTFEHLGSGTVRIISNPGGNAGNAPYDPSILEQIGVGGEVYDLPPGTGSLTELNKPPVARFSVNPDTPQYGDIIILNASGSFDPEANISKYIWNFTGDDAGKFNQTTESDTIAIPTGEISDVETLDAGRYTVELTVVDSVGNKGTTSEFVKVAGLVYGGDAMATDLDGDSNPQGVQFHLVNKHSETVYVTEAYIDPEDDGIDVLSDGMYGDGNHEITFNQTDSGPRIGYADQGGFNIFDGGRIVKEYEWNEIPDVGDSTQPLVYFMEFRKGFDFDMTGKHVETAFRYYVEDGSEKVYYSTQFNMTPGSPYVSGLSPSTYDQCWRIGGSGHKIDATFQNVDETDSAVADVLVASGTLETYNWPTRLDIDQPNTQGKVQVTGDLDSVSISDPEYLVVKLTVWNEHGSKTKRFYIKVVPSGMTCN